MPHAAYTKQRYGGAIAHSVILKKDLTENLIRESIDGIMPNWRLMLENGIARDSCRSSVRVVFSVFSPNNTERLERNAYRRLLDMIGKQWRAPTFVKTLAALGSLEVSVIGYSTI